MITVDTNLLVRLLTKDDARQARRAARIMESDNVFIPKAVMLETEWVLRHAYGIGKDVIMRGCQKLLGLPNVSVEDPHAIAQAISWYGSGFDFADALHLTSSTKADRFITFDNALAKRAQQVSSIPVVKP